MMILSIPKQLEILKTILVNRILMVFQKQPMLGNVSASMRSLGQRAGPCAAMDARHCWALFFL
jgi:hypothetical protein